MISDGRFFLGILVDKDLSRSLEQTSSDIKSSFIHPDYLQQLKLHGQEYLGKYVEFPLLLDNLKEVSENIKSLVRRITPGYEISDKMILLMAFS